MSTIQRIDAQSFRIDGGILFVGRPGPYESDALMITERSKVKTLVLATMFSAVAVLPFAAPAGADELISIPVTGVHRGPEGSTVTVALVNVPADLVGQTCQIIGETVNQHSVHPGNDLLVKTGGRTFLIPDFEDEGDIVHDAGETDAIGETIELVVRFGPDGASSGGFKVFVTCGEDIIPTTTVPATTVPESTVPETTAPETTVPETTVPESTVPETTAPVSTTEAPTSTEPAGPTVTEQPSTTAEPVGVASTDVTTSSTSTTEVPPAGPATGELPVTGAQTWWIVGAGIALAGAGLALVRASKLSLD